MTDMASRIFGLERTVARFREEAKRAPAIQVLENTQSGQLATALHRNDLSEGSREDVLVQKGSSSQYFNEIFLSRVIEDERNIESVLTPALTESPQPPISSPFNALGILSSPSLSITPASYHPSKQQAVRLWKIYLDGVEGCTGVKISHLPTDEIKVYSTIDDPTSASAENLALCFAIYFASTASIDGLEAEGILDQDKQPCLLQFKYGLEQAFAHGDFLDCPTITGLQALAIYLTALRTHNHGKGIWILNGLAVRIAQSLGLHRDGELLGLPPFQCEIRRRLWWNLLARDGRAGEDYGLQDTSSLLLASDVRPPTNLDDMDLYPEMPQLPPARESWTAMTFSIIYIDLAKTIQKLSSIATAASFSSPPREEVRMQIMRDTSARIEKWLPYCNSVIPLHRLTLHCSRFLFRKLDFITRLQWSLLQRPGPHADFVTDENLIEALDILEPRLCGDDEMLKPFTWARKAYPQYHVTMYILLHLCVKPEGPSIERAWAAVETLFSRELWDESTIGFGSKWRVLTALKAKAMTIRDKSRKQRRGRGAEITHPISDPAPREVTAESEGRFAHLRQDPGNDWPDSYIGTDEWPNWATLVQGFQLDTPDVFWR